MPYKKAEKEGFRKIYITQRIQKPKEELIKWNRKSRNKIHQFNYHPKGKRFLPVYLEDDNDNINTKEKLGKWMFERFGYGYFLIKTYTKKRGKDGRYHKSPNTVAEVEIKKGKVKEYDAFFRRIAKLKKYKFWKEKT